MPRSKLTAAALADVCARLVNGESQKAIYKRWGIDRSTLKGMIEVLRSGGLKIEVRAAARLDPDREKKLHSLFASTSHSNRAIVEITGIPLSSINKSRIRYNNALVQAGEELPRCECGQYLHHARVCWARQRETMKKAGIRCVRTLDAPVAADVRLRLLRGETAQSIAERVGLHKTNIFGFLRSFTTEERHQREAAFRIGAGRRRSVALTKKIMRPMATDPANDPLYARIAAAVPRGIDPALRDDMISQAYLEVLEGRLKDDNFSAGMKRVRGRVFAAFANPWGNLSLDAVLGDNAGRAMIERIPAGSSAFA